MNLYFATVAFKHVQEAISCFAAIDATIHRHRTCNAVFTCECSEFTFCVMRTGSGKIAAEKRRGEDGGDGAEEENGRIREGKILAL